MANKVYVIGDVHGSYKPFRDLYTYLNSEGGKLDETDTIIALGDCGFQFFFNHRDEEFKKKVRSYAATIFVVRGNHEERASVRAKLEPDKWTEEMFWDGVVYVEKEYSYIKYALDYPSKYIIPNSKGQDIKTLVIPGAYSVDKEHRIANNWSWFPQEQLTPEEMGIGTDLALHQSWDLVLSHTCPICYEPTDLFLSNVDQSMVDKTMERYLGEIEYQINYKLWLWGHYHATRIYPKFNNSDRIMLFNTEVLDLKKYFESNDADSSLIKIC